MNKKNPISESNPNQLADMTPSMTLRLLVSNLNDTVSLQFWSAKPWLGLTLSATILLDMKSKLKCVLRVRMLQVQN